MDWSGGQEGETSHEGFVIVEKSGREWMQASNETGRGFDQASAESSARKPMRPRNPGRSCALPRIRDWLKDRQKSCGRCVSANQDGGGRENARVGRARYDSASGSACVRTATERFAGPIEARALWRSARRREDAGCGHRRLVPRKSLYSKTSGSSVQINTLLVQHTVESCKNEYLRYTGLFWIFATR